jgi:hypothetical protein
MSVPDPWSLALASALTGCLGRCDTRLSPFSLQTAYQLKASRNWWATNVRRRPSWSTDTRYGPHSHRVPRSRTRYSARRPACHTHSGRRPGWPCMAITCGFRGRAWCLVPACLGSPPGSQSSLAPPNLRSSMYPATPGQPAAPRLMRRAYSGSVACGAPGAAAMLPLVTSAALLSAGRRFRRVRRGRDRLPPPRESPVARRCGR